MRVIPVLDLISGQAVHAVAGHRDRYQPLQSILHASSEPIELARVLRDQCGFDTLYIADLDAIAGRPSLRTLYHDLADLGLNLWVDAGVRAVEEIAPLHDAGVAVVVLGLESLPGPSLLRRVSTAHLARPLKRWVVPTRRRDYAFSLDLRDGRPLVATERAWGTSDPLEIAAEAVAAGLSRLIVLDLARVGTGQGPGTLPLLAALHAAYPDIELIAGGGIVRPDHLQVIERIGISTVLIGSALHDGRLRPSPTGLIWEDCADRVGPCTERRQQEQQDWDGQV